MSNKIRSLMIMAAVLVTSVLVWSAVAAQDATVEPTAEAPATMEAPPATMEATPEAGADMPMHAERPFLGVSLQDGTDGVTIVEVVDGSGAATAGLMAGDVITAVNGTDVKTVAEVAAAISALKVGDTVTIDYTRGSDTLTATATLGKQDKPMQDNGGSGNGNGQNGPRGQGRNDMMFGLEYNSADQSWTISNLPESSALYTAGLRAGDVIKTIDGKTYDPASLARYLVSLDASASVTLSVERDGAAQDISVTASDLMGIVGMRGMLRDNGMFDNNGNGNGDFGQMMPFMQMAFGNGRLGVAFQPIDAQVAQENSLTVTEGALITDVQAGTPAETAGLKVNDVVTAVNGEAVDEEHTLRDRLIAYEPGDTVTLTVLRDGASQDIQATLDEPLMPDMGGMFGGGFPFDFHFRGQDGGGFPFDMHPGQDGMEATPEATPNA